MQKEEGEGGERGGDISVKKKWSLNTTFGTYSNQVVLSRGVEVVGQGQVLSHILWATSLATYHLLLLEGT